MKFKVDENLPKEIAQRLIQSGHDALTVSDQHMIGSKDDYLNDVCFNENRVLVSLDTDFAQEIEYREKDFMGAIVMRLHFQSKSHILSVFENVIGHLDKEPLEGNIWIVDEHRVRIRQIG